MKRIGSWIAMMLCIATIMVSFAACGSKKDPSGEGSVFGAAPDFRAEHGQSLFACLVARGCGPAGYYRELQPSVQCGRHGGTGTGLCSMPGSSGRCDRTHGSLFPAILSHTGKSPVPGMETVSAVFSAGRSLPAHGSGRIPAGQRSVKYCACMGRCLRRVKHQTTAGHPGRLTSGTDCSVLYGKIHECFCPSVPGPLFQAFRK